MIAKLRLYLPLIKALQTGLLLTTGLAGYFSARPVWDLGITLGLAASLFLAISGSTILNMWHDYDIDAQMKRARLRPSASGALSRTEVLRAGLLLSLIGVAWAIWIDTLYGVVVFAGLFFDVVVYTFWLKRRTCWSIVWGGIAGAMPVLAGRALAVGGLDWAGLLLAAAILFWIPTHTLTFSIKFQADYEAACVPTFPSTYGLRVTRGLIGFSSLLSTLCIGAAAIGVGVSTGILGAMAVLSVGLVLLSIQTIVKPSDRVNLTLFKYASLYMLAAMVLLALG